MAKVKVKVVRSIVDGKGHGETLSIDEKSAAHLESIGYVERLAEKKDDSKKDGKNDKKGKEGKA